MLGLAKNSNRLVDHDPRWTDEFEAERTRLWTALSPWALAIEHYGSTAVPGLRAKPILDLLVAVQPLDRWAECKEPLEGLGYDYAEKAGVPGHYIFGRGRLPSERTHLVHIVEFGSDEWRLNLAFRDALRTDPILRRRYEVEKERACADAPTSRAEYNALKHAFIEAAKQKMR